MEEPSSLFLSRSSSLAGRLPDGGVTRAQLLTCCSRRTITTSPHSFSTPLQHVSVASARCDGQHRSLLCPCQCHRRPASAPTAMHATYLIAIVLLLISTTTVSSFASEGNAIVHCPAPCLPLNSLPAAFRHDDVCLSILISLPSDYLHSSESQCSEVHNVQGKGKYQNLTSGRECVRNESEREKESD